MVITVYNSSEIIPLYMVQVHNLSSHNITVNRGLIRISKSQYVAHTHTH